MHRQTLLLILVLILVAVAVSACATPTADDSRADPGSEPALEASPAPETELEIADDVEQRLEQYVPIELTADLSALAASERRTMGYLVEVGRLMDEIFLRQVWTGNPELRRRLERAEGPLVEPGLEYFRINFGPWDRLAEMEPFIGEMPHPPGTGYYPVDMTKEEFERWIETHPEDAEAFRSLTTVIRRQDGELVAVPYSEAYRRWLEPAVQLLRRAAATTTNESLRRFLELRATAFLTDDYFESDLAWMNLDSPVEVTVGPYEVYEDGLFGYKAAFEEFLTVEVPAESARLARFEEKLPWLERNLPIPDEHKNLERGTESPIRVVDVVFSGGDTKAGVQTIAFNLPNDERVRERKGSKKVLLRNIIRAKYESILEPIAARTLVPEQAAEISFDAFFNEILHHELAHGLGPGIIEIDGRQTEVRLELEEHYSTIEEAKADVMGVYDILALVEQGVMDERLRDSLVPTYLAGLFRAVRFGLDEAHGQGVAAHFNYLREHGALEITEEGLYRAVPERFPAVISDLLREILMLQATGDLEGTVEFLARYGVASQALRAAVARLDDVPVDVKPLYPQADALAAEVDSEPDSDT